MIGIDTNVLVRYVVRDDETGYALAAAALSTVTSENPGFITQVVLAEFYWVLRAKYGYDRSACLKAIRGLVETDSLEFDDGEGVVRALTLAESGADFADGLIHGTGELFGVSETVTLDQKAATPLGWRLLRGSDQ